MQSYIKLFMLGVILLLGSPGVSAGFDMSPYPAPKPGYRRMVFFLPVLSDEENHKVEIIVGKMLHVDCNKHWFIGHLSEELARGWGYTYFSLNLVTGPTSTLLACPPKQQDRLTFVPVVSDEGLLPYNSKLPMVVYVPSEFEVHYQIWTTDGKQGEARVQ